MIPSLSHSGLLPPFLGGDPAVSADRAPYLTDMANLATTFATSITRGSMLEGLLRYREKLEALGFTGFQWIAGSFAEDCENLRGRPPGDIDVVSFVHRPISVRAPAQWTQFVEAELSTLAGLFMPASKLDFNCDAYIVELDVESASLVPLTHYWYGLFSHSRNGEWKGILQVPFPDPAADALAGAALSQRRAL